MMIDVPNSEVVDRATILMIKLDRLDCDREINLLMHDELENLLEMIEDTAVNKDSNMFRRLKQVNEYLWDAIEEQKKWFDKDTDYSSFIDASKKVVRLNDSRFELKCAIDEITESEIREFKE